MPTEVAARAMVRQPDEDVARQVAQQVHPITPAASEGMTDSVYGVGAVLLVAVVTAFIRKQFAGAKVAEAGATIASSASESTSNLFELYHKEVVDLRAQVNDLSTKVNASQQELATMRAMYQATAAGERRYREAFADLLQAHSLLLIEARPLVGAERLADVERRVTDLIMSLARPLEIEEVPQ